MCDNSQPDVPTGRVTARPIDWISNLDLLHVKWRAFISNENISADNQIPYEIREPCD